MNLVATFAHPIKDFAKAHPNIHVAVQIIISDHLSTIASLIVPYPV